MSNSSSKSNPAEAEEEKLYRIGCALSAKKEQSFLRPSFLQYSSERGIAFIRIDPGRPLIEQGPFHCIVHKLYEPEWKLQLRRFAEQNPHVPIIDSPDRINLLRNRISMLEVISKPGIPENVGVPAQWVVSEPCDLIKEGASEELNLKFPVIAKPLEADGTETSHKLYLVFDREGLIGLPTPIVLQEFVNHGGVVFKVYVVREHVKCVKRRSLPDVSVDNIGVGVEGCSLPFSQLSNLSKEETGDFEGVEMPPERFVAELARGLREKLGLNLFNFDVIRDAKDKDRYLVIDINYFPGYAKMPGYEHVLTEFFLDLARNKTEK